MAEQTWLLLTCAAIACFAGFSWLALAMDVHWKQVQGNVATVPAPRTLLRMLGASGLIVAAVLCFQADRPSMAVLVWVMFMAISAPLVAMTLSWRPGLLRVLWPRS